MTLLAAECFPLESSPLLESCSISSARIDKWDISPEPMPNVDGESPTALYCMAAMIAPMASD
jgi:hypothetical protein